MASSLRERSQSADRAAQSLLAIARKPQTLAELSRNLEVERRALGRIIASLEEYGFLTRASGSGLIELGRAATSLVRGEGSEQLDLVSVARAPLEQLKQATKCTTILHEVRGNYLHPELILSPTDVIAVSYPAGRTIALWEGVGRSVMVEMSQQEQQLLNHRSELPGTSTKLADVRRTGVAVSFGEVVGGVSAVGSAVHDAGGVAVGVVAIVAPEGAHPEEHAFAVRSTADAISRRLGYTPHIDRDQ